MDVIFVENGFIFDYKSFVLHYLFQWPVEFASQAHIHFLGQANNVKATSIKIQGPGGLKRR